MKQGRTVQELIQQRGQGFFGGDAKKRNGAELAMKLKKNDDKAVTELDFT